MNVEKLFELQIWLYNQRQLVGTGMQTASQENREENLADRQGNVQPKFESHDQGANLHQGNPNDPGL